MKTTIRCASLIAGLALTGWAGAAEAFSLGRSVAVINLVEDPRSGNLTLFETAEVVVGDGVELPQYGGIWDIDLIGAPTGNRHQIRFTLNSLFGNVTSGNDLYIFLAAFGAPGEGPSPGAGLVAVEAILSDGFSTLPGQRPVVSLLGPTALQVAFPVGFAPGGLRPEVNPNFQPLHLTVNLTLEPAEIPTPALLPGLLGLGWATLRRYRQDAGE